MKNEKDKENLLISFQAFNIRYNNEKMDSLILEEYKKQYFFSFINKKINRKNLNDGIIYFTSIFMYTLNSFANRKQNYFLGNELFIGKDLPFSSILKFEKEKGNIIFFSNFKIQLRLLNGQKERLLDLCLNKIIKKKLFFLFYSLLKIIEKIAFHMV